MKFCSARAHLNGVTIVGMHQAQSRVLRVKWHPNFRRGLLSGNMEDAWPEGGLGRFFQWKKRRLSKWHLRVRERNVKHISCGINALISKHRSIVHSGMKRTLRVNYSEIAAGRNSSGILNISGRPILIASIGDASGKSPNGHPTTTPLCTPITLTVPSF